MATIRRTGLVAAAPTVVWRTVSDPKLLPAWWPSVERVEGVDSYSFTEVLRSSRGKLIRADFLRRERDEPRRVSWSQQLEGTPFAQVFDRREVLVELTAADGGHTSVSLTVEQELKGAARYVPLNRGGVKRQLDEALRALADVHR